MKCSKCNRNAIIFQRYSGLHLCEQHFVKDFETRAKRALRKHRWIEPRDRIAIAMSGGKDSSALCYFMNKVFGKRRDITLFAVTIDEGIAGYRLPRVAERVAVSIGIPWHSTSFEEIYGTTLDEIVATHGDALSCSYCGVLRRAALNSFVRDLGASKIAFGFNLDDEAQSVLMNVLRGDMDRLIRPQVPVEGLVPRIRPFISLPEREVALYAHLFVEGFEEKGCPYSHNALRADVRSLLNDYNYRHPATKYALVNLGEKLSGLGETAPPLADICPRCGEPTLGPCRTCQIVDEVVRRC